MNPYASFWPPVPGVSFAFLDTPLPSASYLPFWPALLGELYRAWDVVGGGNRFVLYFMIKQLPILGDVTRRAALRSGPSLDGVPDPSPRGAHLLVVLPVRHHHLFNLGPV